MIKVLLPYRSIDDIQPPIYDRFPLDGQRLTLYIQQEPYGLRWQIRNTNEWFKQQYKDKLIATFDTLEAAMEALDKILIEKGYKLLNDKEDVDKYMVLL